MNILDKLSKFFGFGSKSRSGGQTASFNRPLFSSFGRDVMASDIVKTAIHRVAEEVSKCELRSVILRKEPRQVVVPDDDLNGIFCGQLNAFMTARDFLYKVAYLTVKNCNCFIYPEYYEVPNGPGLVKRVYTAFYPLEADTVTIYQTETETRITFTKAGTEFDMPYLDVIHIRHQFGAHPFLGGDSAGTRDVRALLGNLQILHVIKECVPKSLEASLAMKGILTLRGVPEADAKALTRDEFENHLISSKHGIAVTDYEGDFSAVNINPTDLPPGIMSWIQQEILSPFGVSVPILAGKFTDDEYSAFYQTAIEGLLLSISQAFTARLFTPRQLAYGHQVKAYDRIVQSLSFKTRKEIVEMVKDSALLDADEQRELLGYEPNGQPTRVSLNYVDASIVNAYQLSTLNKKPQNTGKED